MVCIPINEMSPKSLIVMEGVVLPIDGFLTVELVLVHVIRDKFLLLFNVLLDQFERNLGNNPSDLLAHTCQVLIDVSAMDTFHQMFDHLQDKQ